MFSKILFVRFSVAYIVDPALVGRGWLAGGGCFPSGRHVHPAEDRCAASRGHDITFVLFLLLKKKNANEFFSPPLIKNANYFFANPLCMYIVYIIKKKKQ